MEFGVGRARSQSNNVADLGKEFVPALMRKDLARRAALDRSSPGDWIPELRVGGVGAEVGVVRQSLGRPLVGEIPGEVGVAVCWVTHHGNRRLQIQPGQRGGEPLSSAQRAPWEPNRKRGEGTAHKRTKAVLPGQESGGREKSPFVKVASRNLADGESLYDLSPIFASTLCLFLSNAGCLA